MFFRSSRYLLHLQLIAAHSQPECRSRDHSRATHAHCSQYLVPETQSTYSNKVSSRVSNISSGDPHFHARAGSGAPILTLRWHIPTIICGKCPPGGGGQLLPAIRRMQPAVMSVASITLETCLLLAHYTLFYCTVGLHSNNMQSYFILYISKHLRPMTSLHRPPEYSLMYCYRDYFL